MNIVIPKKVDSRTLIIFSEDLQVTKVLQVSKGVVLQHGDEIITQHPYKNKN